MQHQVGTKIESEITCGLGILIDTSDGDTMIFDPLAAGELAVGDRNGSGVERVHPRGEDPPLTGHSPCLKLLVKLYGIGGGGHPYE